MSKPRVFIGSSKRALPLVEALISQIKDAVEPVGWADLGAFPPGCNLLDELLKHSEKSDFAIVLLTQDFTLIPREKLIERLYRFIGKARRTRFVGPSPNTLFEMGLFLGAFDEPHRCFVISSLSNDFFSELTDLAGTIYLRIPEPTPTELSRAAKELDRAARANRAAVLTTFTDPVTNAVKNAAERIKHEITAQKLRSHGTVSLNQLMERERVLSGEKNMRVMVRSRKPAERALEFAQVVYDNLTNKIDYHYLFDLKQSSYHEIGLMLLALAVTNEVDLKERVQNPSEQQLQEHLEFSSRERVENNLKQMRKHLFVHFVDFEAFEEFCIHRYETDQAQCFWKLSNDRFLVIDRNSSEKRGKFYSRHIHWGRESIFNPENDWVKWARQPRPDARTLDQEIMDKFPEALHPVVLEACFGGIAAGV